MQALPEPVSVRQMHAPENIKIGQCVVEFLYPEHMVTASRPRNDHSQVIKISDSFRSFLFTGDIERDAEAMLAETSHARLRSAVLKIAHHGSRTSSSVPFLRCVSPGLAVFSYGRGNRFNFPHREVVENVKRLGIPFLSTARSGGIRLVSLPDRIEMETSY